MQCVDHIIEVLDLAACQDTSKYETRTHKPIPGVRRLDAVKTAMRSTAAACALRIRVYHQPHARLPCSSKSLEELARLHRFRFVPVFHFYEMTITPSMQMCNIVIYVFRTGRAAPDS